MSVQNIKPSTRDLAHFVSPNSGEQNELIQVSPDFFQNQSYQTQLEKWEDNEIAGLILTETLESYTDHLKTLVETLTCSLIWNHNIDSKDQISAARASEIDAILSDPSQNWEQLKVHAQTMNVRLIPKISSLTEWEQHQTERFLYLTEEVLEKISQPCESWIISEAKTSNVKLYINKQ